MFCYCNPIQSSHFCPGWHFDIFCDIFCVKCNPGQTWLLCVKILVTGDSGEILGVCFMLRALQCLIGLIYRPSPNVLDVQFIQIPGYVHAIFGSAVSACHGAMHSTWHPVRPDAAHTVLHNCCIACSASGLTGRQVHTAVENTFHPALLFPSMSAYGLFSQDVKSPGKRHGFLEISSCKSTSVIVQVRQCGRFGCRQALPATVGLQAV